MEVELRQVTKVFGDTVALADVSFTVPAGQFVTPKFANHYPLEKLLTSVPLESKLPLVQSLNEKCFARSGLVAKVNAVFHDEQKRVMVVTSDGVKAEDLKASTDSEWARPCANR